MDSHFSRAKIVNYDLIYHQCHRDKLNNQVYKTNRGKDFQNFKDGIRNRAMSSAIKSECDDVRFEPHLLKLHISNYVEKDLISNGLLLGRKKGNVQRTFAKV